MRVTVVGTVYNCRSQAELPGVAPFVVNLSEHLLDEEQLILIKYTFTSDSALQIGGVYQITAVVQGIYHFDALRDEDHEEVLGVDGNVIAVKRIAVDYEE